MREKQIAGFLDLTRERGGPLAGIGMQFFHQASVRRPDGLRIGRLINTEDIPRISQTH